MRPLIDRPDSDLFDVLAHIRFGLDPKARADRADAVRAKLAEMGLGERDVGDAVEWARDGERVSGRDGERPKKG